MKGKLGWCKRIGISVQENSSKWATTSKIKRSRPGDWHIPGTVVRKAEGYNLSEVQSAVIPPSEKYHKTDAYPVGPFAQCLWGWSLLFPPTLHAYVTKHPRTRNKMAENGSFLAEEKIRAQPLKRSWRKIIINPLSLDAQMVFSRRVMMIPHTYT